MTDASAPNPHRLPRTVLPRRDEVDLTPDYVATIQRNAASEATSTRR